uniref:DUF19 domain-containing protein n=1 Tax=Tetranychus urticae TaxID=32264 RepID=T1K6C0_TETUR
MFKLFVGLTVLVVAGQSAPQPKCTQTEDDFDNCAAELTVFGNDAMIMPTTEDEMDQHCNKSFKSIQCVRDYSANCMVSFPKTVFGVFQYDFKRDIKKRCHTKEGRVEFMKHMQCGKAKGGFGPLNTCMKNYDAQMEWIMQNVAKEERVLTGCCSLHWVHNCFVTKAKELCEAVTGPETSDYFDKMVGSTIAEGVDYTCGKHKSYEDCAAHLDGNIWKTLLEIGEDPSKINFVPRHKSPITTSIKMFTELDQGS